MGDFGKYILRTALRNVASGDPQALQRATERAIFDRALELGWNPERFRATDRGRSWDRDRPVERVGKKYQWIGLYEVLGRIVDSHQVTEPWGTQDPASTSTPSSSSTATSTLRSWSGAQTQLARRGAPGSPRQTPAFRQRP
jgi:hypothetical protein